MEKRYQGVRPPKTPTSLHLPRSVLYPSSRLSDTLQPCCIFARSQPLPLPGDFSHQAFCFGPELQPVAVTTSAFLDHYRTNISSCQRDIGQDYTIQPAFYLSPKTNSLLQQLRNSYTYGRIIYKLNSTNTPGNAEEGRDSELLRKKRKTPLSWTPSSPSLRLPPSLPGPRTVCFSHRFSSRSGTSTAFLEVDPETFRTLGLRGRLGVNYIIDLFEASPGSESASSSEASGTDASRCTNQTIQCYHSPSRDHSGPKLPSLSDPRTATPRTTNSSNHKSRSSTCPSVRVWAAKQ
ncbi:hypothetical protein LAZ67_X001716 [Cordylochernes scorpioides]|uniref:Uncharacterized protein n=1 Tax=Cordylochernes scorpioides TaxID=51811 RepID=A0ABY6LVV6_9ARAC|nr:hypothetical protein LAZ67_X001716 [Cordylochernes scorpioides]